MLKNLNSALCFLGYNGLGSPLTSKEDAKGVRDNTFALSSYERLGKKRIPVKRSISARVARLLRKNLLESMHSRLYLTLVGNMNACISKASAEQLANRTPGVLQVETTKNKPGLGESRTGPVTTLISALELRELFNIEWNSVQ